MNQYHSRKELKSLARNLLRGNYLSVILTMIFVSFLSSGLQSASTLLPLPNTILGNGIYYFVSILLFSICGIFSIGLSLYFLNLCCQKSLNIMDLFYGFTVNPKKSFCISLIFTLINFLCSIPSFFVKFTASIENPALYIKESLILSTVLMFCNIIYILVTLGFSQVFYLMLDFPSLSIKQLFQYSLRLMKQNTLRYVLLLLSFLPMFLLGIGSFGIGFLWVKPYIYTTFTLFYLDLIKKKATP